MCSCLYFFSTISTKYVYFQHLRSLSLSEFHCSSLTNSLPSTIIQNPEIIVKITNALKAKNQLTFHSKSGDGVHKLTPWASYDFSVCPNLWFSTLFYSFFQWPGSFHYFDMYVNKRDRKNCERTLCSWYVSEQNVCMFNYKTNNYDIR